MARPVKADTLRFRWKKGKRLRNPQTGIPGGDITGEWGGECSARDYSIVQYAFSDQPKIYTDGEYKRYPSMIQELVNRGYDITTLRFSIRKKKP